MKFLIDAQLPARLAQFLNRAGHDVVHTAGLPHGNRSTDSQIAQHADTEDRVVVTKDQDFRDGNLLGRSPRKLLVIATGNITNDALLSLFELHLEPSSRRSMRPTSSSCPKTPSRLAGAGRTPTADAQGIETDPRPNRISPPTRPPSNCTLKASRVPNRAESSRNPSEFAFCWVPTNSSLPGISAICSRSAVTLHTREVGGSSGKRDAQADRR